ncbi:MAG: Arm DNA-binding domain-containing protein [Rickettsiales bacterium]
MRHQCSARILKNNLNSTKTNIQSIPIQAKGKVIYKDTKEKGLSLYITSNGTVSFFIRKRINSRGERVILGHFPEMSIDKCKKTISEF